MKFRRSLCQPLHRYARSTQPLSVPQSAGVQQSSTDVVPRCATTRTRSLHQSLRIPPPQPLSYSDLLPCPSSRSAAPKFRNSHSTMSHDIEAAKRAAATQAVRENFPPDARFVGIGSGTTIVYVVEAINALKQDVSRTCFVPTGYQSRQLITDSGLISIQYDSLPPTAVLDVSFDGADEVDEDLNCIKGGGACLFQEKLVAMRSKQFICVAGSHTHPPSSPPKAIAPKLTTPHSP